MEDLSLEEIQAKLQILRQKTLELAEDIADFETVVLCKMHLKKEKEGVPAV